MYRGLMVTIIPRPMPVTSRKTISMAIWTDPAIKAPPIVLSRAAAKIPLLLPSLSETQPWRRAPMAAPNEKSALIAPRILAVYELAAMLWVNYNPHHKNCLKILQSRLKYA